MKAKIQAQAIRNRLHPDDGFTILELSFVLMIFSMIVMAVMTGFGLYSKQQAMQKTENALDHGNTALLEYVATFGAYPCPADPTLGPGDLNYGREQRVGGLAYTDPGYDEAACAAASSVLGKDVDNTPGGEPVLYGALPAVTIAERLLQTGYLYADFSDADSADGWGRKLTYAVTASLTNRAIFNDHNGAIGIIDEHNNSLVTEREIDSNNNHKADPAEDLNGNGIIDRGRYPHFTLVSHGQNGRGAYMRNGELVEGCPASLPIPNPPPPTVTAVNEIKNCKIETGTFLSGLTNEAESSYNDDIVRFSSYVNSALWRYTGQSKIENTNTGYVGVGTDEPEQALHVVGQIVTGRARARAYTDRVGTSYLSLPPDSIGGNGLSPASKEMQCNEPGEVVVKIEGSATDNPVGTDANGKSVYGPRVTCAKPFGNGAPPDMTCQVVGGIQYVMYGVTANKTGPGYGSLLCCNPTLPRGGPAPACP